MTDKEMLEWVMGMMERGVQVWRKYEWFLNGEEIPAGFFNEMPDARFKELKQSGALVRKHTGYYLSIDLQVEDETTIAEGASIREAIAEAMKEEKGAPAVSPCP